MRVNLDINLKELRLRESGGASEFVMKMQE
jgi:hypothetical protein